MKKASKIILSISGLIVAFLAGKTYLGTRAGNSIPGSGTGAAAGDRTPGASLRTPAPTDTPTGAPTPPPSAPPSDPPSAPPTAPPSTSFPTYSPIAAVPDYSPSVLAAMSELAETDLPRKDSFFKYLDAGALADPVADAAYSDRLGFTKHTWDPLERNGTNGTTPAFDGPSCILGSAFSAYTRPGGGGGRSLLIFLQGGGACWRGEYSCYARADQTEPATLLDGGAASGLHDPDDTRNPFAGYGVVYAPYCDGSVWLGDDTVEDGAYNPDLGSNDDGKYRGGFRNHRGLRNLSATVRLARRTFPDARKITLAGHSAGGAGAALAAPLVRRAFPGVELTILNDAGPAADNPAHPAGTAAREGDWGYCRFLPASLPTCRMLDFLDYILRTDPGVRMAFYSAAADAVAAEYLDIPVTSGGGGGGVPVPLFLSGNRDFLDHYVASYGPLADGYPGRFRTFVVASYRFVFDGFAGTEVPFVLTHGLVQKPEFYDELEDSNGGGALALSEWIGRFLKGADDWQDVYVS